MKLNGYVGTILNKDGFLYNNGVTNYKIVIPKKATLIEKKAAKELALIFSYAGVKIKTVTDSKLKVSDTQNYIALGNTKFFKSLNIKMLSKEFKFDGFIIETIGSTFVINGVGGLGTVFGAYSFMERLAGYVYYAEDEIKINKKSAPLKEIHIKETPSFFGRNAFSYDTYKHPRIGMRYRVNGEMFEYKELGTGVSPWSTLNDQSYATQILDYTKYAKDHPEWFSFYPDYQNVKPPRCGVQICYSKGQKSDAEGGFFDTFVNNLINNYIIPEKDKMFFMLGMSDIWHFCECEECKKAVLKYKHSGHAIHFVNKVADAVESWRIKNAPEREIYCVAFAYIHLFEPPVYEKDGEFYPIDSTVIARDNVVIQYAPIGANYFYPIMDKEHNLESYNAIKGWAKITKHFAVWDYRQDFMSHAYPFPTYLTAQQNLDSYLEYGFMDLFHQAQHLCKNSPFINIDNFARARMHWDMSENYNDLFNEAMSAYYKGALPYVQEYLQMIKEYQKVMISRGHWGECHHAVIKKPWFHTISELKALATPLNNALAFIKTLEDKTLAKKLKVRILALTLFYKLTLIVCFTLDLPKSEMFKLIKDVRKISKLTGFNYFQSHKPLEEVLIEAEKVLNGDLKDQDRYFKLKKED